MVCANWRSVTVRTLCGIRLQHCHFGLGALCLVGIGLEEASVQVRQIVVVVLTAHALSREALKKSIELGARAYLPKEEIDNMAPFLEDVLELSYESAWAKPLSKLAGVFGAHFGPDWRKSEKEFWDEFEKCLAIEHSTVIES